MEDYLYNYTVATIRGSLARADGKEKDGFFDWGIRAVTKQTDARQSICCIKL